MKFMLRIFGVLLMGVVTIVLSSCKKEVTANLILYGLSNATDSSCMVRGTVNIIGDDITEAGILVTSKTSSALVVLTYNNSQHKLSNRSLTDFVITLSGLSADSTYRYRLFAKSNDSIYYGLSNEFKPIPHYDETAFIQGGTFNMGATSEQIAYANSDEYPVHRVTLSDYNLGTKEVTNLQYVQFLKSRKVSSSGMALTEQGDYKTLLYRNYHGIFYNTDSATWSVLEGYEQNPVVRVTWYGANEYARWASARLPTEAEWEWAAREGVLTTNHLLSGGDAADVASIAWYKQNTKDKPEEFKDLQPVGTKAPNSLGLYDMSGNAWEWVMDWYLGYLSIPQVNPQSMSDKDAAESGISNKVIRGGSWANGEDGEVDALRVSNRSQIHPSLNTGSCGFRIAKD